MDVHQAALAGSFGTPMSEAVVSPTAVQEFLTKIDGRIGQIALTHGLRHAALNDVAHSFLRLEQAVDALLVQTTDEKVPRSREPRPSMEPSHERRVIAAELRALRRITSNFVAPAHACRGYHCLMDDLAVFASLLETYITCAGNTVSGTDRESSER